VFVSAFVSGFAHANGETTGRRAPFATFRDGTCDMSPRFQTPVTRLLVDPRRLPIRDRALLRILNRTKAATTADLSELTRSHLRKVQHRLRALWSCGLLERTTASPPARGSSPLTYRLAPAARQRLGYRDRQRLGVEQLQHRLDTVATAAALSRPWSAGMQYPMQAWLTETMARGLIGREPAPDSIVAIQLESGSGVLCLETDEGTQHRPVIRRKLLAYARALAVRPGWHLLVVAPSAVRLGWLIDAAGTPAPGLAHRAWIVELAAVRRDGLRAIAAPIGWRGTASDLASLLTDRNNRRTRTPVASRAWVVLLGSGGGESLEEALR
jgi:hypothetical protein